MRVAPSGPSFAPAHPGRAKTRPFPRNGAQRDLLASERSASTSGLLGDRPRTDNRSLPSLTAIETGG